LRSNNIIRDESILFANLGSVESGPGRRAITAHRAAAGHEIKKSQSNESMTNKHKLLLKDDVGQATSSPKAPTTKKKTWLEAATGDHTFS